MTNNKIIEFIKTLYSKSFEGHIPLHAPNFISNEKNYLNKCIESTFVSSVGEFVNEFEERIKKLTGASFAISCTSGTCALHLALIAMGVKPGDEVITQSLTFVGTGNSILQAGASPIFIDSHVQGGIDLEILENFLSSSTSLNSKGELINKKTSKRISACMPVHIFGNPCRLKELKAICDKYQLPIIEDAAEAIGSYYENQHVGTFGLIGAFSFNGNKIITSGGGGALITNDPELAKKLKHLSTTSKVPHKWEFFHDEPGFNYRMPNINAALACAQLESLETYLKNKAETYLSYKGFFKTIDVDFVSPLDESKSNHWLNAILFENEKEKNSFLEYSNSNGVMTRPVWVPLHQLPFFSHCQRTEMKQTISSYERTVNIPSSFRPNDN